MVVEGANGTNPSPSADGSLAPQARSERAPRNSERGERGRGERRPERNRRPDEGSKTEGSGAPETQRADFQAADAAVATAAVSPELLTDGSINPSEPRERRPRGRDRGPRTDRGDRAGRTEGRDRVDPQEQPEPTDQDDRLLNQTPAEPRKSYFSNPATQTPSNPLSTDMALPNEPTAESAPQTSIPALTTAAPAAPASTPLALDTVTEPISRAEPWSIAAEAPAAAGQTAGNGAMPAVSAFLLPVAELHAVAQNSGLSWVNSDPAKVASAQAAISAEPGPIHVPRQRPAPAMLEDGPLVLVETRRDLRDFRLPFEAPSAKP